MRKGVHKNNKFMKSRNRIKYLTKHLRLFMANVRHFYIRAHCIQPNHELHLFYVALSVFVKLNKNKMLPAINNLPNFFK